MKNYAAEVREFRLCGTEKELCIYCLAMYFEVLLTAYAGGIFITIGRPYMRNFVVEKCALKRANIRQIIRRNSIPD